MHSSIHLTSVDVGVFTGVYPFLSATFNQRVFAKILHEFNAYVESFGPGFEDPREIAVTVCRKIVGIRYGPGVQGMVSCLVAFSVSPQVPQACRWLNHLEKSLAKLSDLPNWPSIQSGYRKMLSGNSYDAMAVEAHIGVSIAKIDPQLKMHGKMHGDVQATIFRHSISAEVKVQSGRFSDLPSVDSSGLLRGELDYIVTVREKRAPMNQAETAEYAMEIKEAHDKAAEKIRSEGVTSGRIPYSPKQSKYVNYVMVDASHYLPGKGMLTGIISGGLTERDEVDEPIQWVRDRLSDINKQVPPRSKGRLNVAVLMLPADRGIRYYNDTELLDDSSLYPNVDAIILGDFFNSRDANGISYWAVVVELRSLTSDEAHAVGEVRRAIVS